MKHDRTLLAGGFSAYFYDYLTRGPMEKSMVL